MRTHTDAAPVHVGEVIAGKYRVEREIGAGGMGVVVAVRHLELDELRALKLMNPAWLHNAQAVERFQREARAVTRLRNEHICRVHDVGKLETGIPYIIMELLEGRGLDSLLKTNGPLPVETAASYMSQICDAIADAHEVGIVHRDLKPGNIFVTTRRSGSPCVKVLDFGIAKLDTSPAMADAAALTGTQDVIGSPSYMSPEQIRSTRNVDFRTDIWSIGVILYELVTGQRPFRGDSALEIIVAVLEVPPPLPSHLRPDLPPALEELILRCLDKDPSLRPQSAAEIGNQLSRFLTGQRTGSERDTVARPMPAMVRQYERTSVLPISSNHQAEHQQTTAPLRTSVKPAENVMATRSRKAATAIGILGAIVVTGTAFYTIKRITRLSTPPPTTPLPPQPCAAGSCDCDNNAANGRETDITSNASHCGACAISCRNDHGSTRCSSGLCVPTCAPSFADCDGDPRNGCETDTRSDVLHCGACGQACGAAHGTPSCSDGKCAITCSPAFGNCNCDAADGCETAFTSPGEERCRPRQIASGRRGALAIVIDTSPIGNIYWTNPESGSLSWVNKRGGEATILSQEGRPTSISMYDDSVYWDDAANAIIKRYNKVTHEQSTIVEWKCGGSCSSFGAAAYGPYAFWTIRYLNPAGEEPGLYSNDPQYQHKPIASGKGVVIGPFGLAVDSTGIYWASSEANGGTIWTASRAPSARPRPLAKVQEIPFSVALDPKGKSIYWTSRGAHSPDRDGPRNGGSIARTATDGLASSARVLAESEPEPTGIAADTVWVYWTNSDGTVKRTRGDGAGHPETLATGQMSPSGIAIDGQCIYWVNTGDGAVMGVSK